MNFVGLHGFLGLPSDFDDLSREMNLSIKAPSLHDSRGLGAHLNFNDFSDQLYSRLKDEFSSVNILGYSMGGRLALEFFSRYPQFINRLYLLSVNVFPIENRAQRTLWDQEWVSRLSSLNFSEFLWEWNSLDIFKGSQNYDRKESEFDKKQLALALDNWSPAKHDLNLMAFVKDSKVRVLVGEEDRKYYPLYKKLSDESFIFIPGVGHRLLLDNPHAVAKIVLEDLRNK